MKNTHHKILKIIAPSLLLISLGLIQCAEKVHAQTSIIDVVQRSLPAIVTIKAVNTQIFKSPSGSAAYDKKSGRFMFARKLRTAHYDRTGAGVIVDPSGLIVTNSHTVAKADKVTITFHNGKKVPGKILSVVRDYDFALIGTKPPFPLNVIKIADSDKVKLRDEIIVVGNSPLLKQSLLGGRVIGIGTHSGSKKGDIANTILIHTSINLYKGDSGGPLLDSKGRLIGLMVAGERNTDHSSFAIPSNIIKKYYKSYLSGVKSK